MTGEDLDPLRRRQYLHPPVVEAMCRLQWANPTPWDFLTPSQAFDRLKSTYPAEPQAQTNVRADFQPSGAGTNAGFQVTTGPEQQFLFANDNQLLVVGPDHIAAHAIQPYEGWDSLHDRLFTSLDLLAGLIPQGDNIIEQVGLRYINQIQVDEPSWEFRDYVHLDLALPDGIPSEVNNFMQRAEIAYPDEPVNLTFTWASIQAAPPGTSAFLLDLDFHHRPTAPFSNADARAALSDLKVKEGRAFEALITDRLRTKFVEDS